MCRAWLTDGDARYASRDGKIDRQANDGTEQACVLFGYHPTKRSHKKTAADRIDQQRLGKTRGGA
jgi:hypothetical protein